MALGLRPGIEMPSSPGPPSDPGTPLLSADDIFKDVLTGLDEAEPPAKPVSREMPARGSVEKRLHDTLSGLLPPKKSVSGSTAPFPSAERSDRPVEHTARVNVAEAMASLAARPQQTPRSGESPARKISSVDKLLSDTLAGLMPPPKTTAAAPPSRPREISREVSGETLRMKVSPIPPSVPPAPPPLKRPGDTTRPVVGGRPASSPGAFGRYQLLEKIGAGGMAEVFKARMNGEHGFEKIVAIKRIVPHMADERRIRDDVRRRGEARGPAQPQQHHAHLRSREGRRLALHRHGVRRRQGPAHALEAREGKGLPAARRARALHRREDRERARLRAPPAGPGRQRAQPRAPRRLAAEHPHQRRRRHQALRLRHREGREQGVDDDVGRAEGQAAVHVARAGLGQESRPTERHLLSRHRCSTRC